MILLNHMLEQQDLQNIGQLMDRKLDELAGIVKVGFDQTATKQEIFSVEKRLDSVGQRLDGVEKRLDGLEQTVNGIDFKLKRHLEISDDRHFDHHRLHKVYQKWFDQIAQKVGVELEMPEQYRTPLESQ